MDNSVAQQVAILNNLMSLASITILRILAFSFYMSIDVFGKHWFKVFPKVREHNPMTIGSIRKSFMNRQFKNKLNRQNSNRVLLVSRTPVSRLVSTPPGHGALPDALVTGTGNPILPQSFITVHACDSSLDSGTPVFIREPRNLETGNSPLVPCSCGSSGNSPSFPGQLHANAYAITFGGAATPPSGHAASTGTHDSKIYDDAYAITFGGAAKPPSGHAASTGTFIHNSMPLESVTPFFGEPRNLETMPLESVTPFFGEPSNLESTLESVTSFFGEPRNLESSFGSIGLPAYTDESF